MVSHSSKTMIIGMFAIVLLFCVSSAFCETFNAVVAQDGSGDFMTVNEAISRVPRNSNTRYNIRVKPGRYSERVAIEPDMKFIAIIGDNPSTTTIVFNRSSGLGFGTNDTGSLSVNGVGFVAKSLTIENSAGPNEGQAVALYNNADLTAFHECNILGHQDTLYANGLGNRQFYKDCNISGTVDFIFGSAKAVFQDCRLLARRSGLENVITAQRCAGPNEDSGFVFQGCHVAASPEVKGPVVAYLGRPWRVYAKVVFMESVLEGIVAPAGWERWDNTSSVDLLFFAEYNNIGAGAGISQRVKWKGFHVLKDDNEASAFTVDNFIGGNVWLPETGVPFRTGLNVALADM